LSHDFFELLVQTSQFLYTLCIQLAKTVCWCTSILSTQRTWCSFWLQVTSNG